MSSEKDAFVIMVEEIGVIRRQIETLQRTSLNKGEAEDFNTAITLDGRIAESWANQALIYERRGEMAKAARSYSQALRLDPNYAPAKTGLARTRGAAAAKPA